MKKLFVTIIFIVLLMSCINDRGENDGIWYRTTTGAKGIFWTNRCQSILLEKGDTIDLNDWKIHEKYALPRMAIVDTIIRYKDL